MSLPVPGPRLELAHSPFSLALDLPDTTGRPVGELTASPPARQGHAFELTKCPFRGVRLGHDMNATALRITAQHQRQALASIQAWRDAQVDDLWLQQDRPADALGVWGLSIAILGLAGLRLRQGRTLTAAEATVHKVLMGVAALAWAALVVYHRPGARSPETADDWLAFGETTGMLVHGRTQRACAGSPARIREVFDVLLGHARVPSDLWLPQPEDVAYGRAVRQLELARAVIVLRRAVAPVRFEVPDDWCGHLCDGLPAEHVRSILKRLRDDPRTGQTVQAAERADSLDAWQQGVLSALAGSR